MKQVNELVSQQAERNTKLSTERRKATKLNACEVPKEGGEQRGRNPRADRNQQILSEMRQKSELMAKEVKRQNQIGVDLPTKNVVVVTSQGTSVGAARVVKSVEEERNVTIVFHVVALDM